jgi:GNAT superfamily N-acetyltransferase
MTTNTVIRRADPTSSEAALLAGALWTEIQDRYGFHAADPFDPAAFTGPIGGFWIATDGVRPVGSVALAALEGDVAELDVMYVAPDHRRAGVARALLAALEEHARSVGVKVLRLRAGEPQPEALGFYQSMGFTPIPAFGKWVDDPTARCLEKSLGP